MINDLARNENDTRWSIMYNQAKQMKQNKLTIYYKYPPVIFPSPFPWKIHTGPCMPRIGA